MGYWGPNILRNFIKTDDSKVIVCCDINQKRYDSIKKIYPWVNFTKDSNEVIKNADVEAVAIITPVNSHYEIVKQALEAGKHVLVSKPITESLAKAEQLVNIAENNNLVLMVDHTFIYHPAVNKLKEIVSGNTLGDIYYIDSIRINLGLFQQDISVIWDLAPHDISIMLHLIDKPVIWVQAVGASHAGQMFESMAYITLQFENNILGHCHVNWLAPMKVRLTTLVGSSKMAVYDDNSVAEKIKIYESGVEIKDRNEIHKTLVQYRKGDIYSPVVKNTEALEIEVNHFLECIKNRKQPITSGLDSLKTMKILEAAEYSIFNNGKRIPLI